ncbi:MAG TPA: hypothetical protein VMX14_03830 [Anaerolineae bacterium]|nr:hypothetical protein [Anaerolineae bacterium]HUW08148.1 hypothetical protein [Anaerolineae bacterium]
MSQITVTFRTGSTVYDLNDGTEFLLVRHEGLGMVPVRRLSEQGPYQHGVTDRGFRVQPRQVLLGIVALATTLETLYDRHEKLLKALNLSNDPIIVTFGYPSGRHREMNAHFAGGLSFPTGNRLGFSEETVIELFCPEGVLRATSSSVETFGIGGAGTGYAVPMPVPVLVGAATLDQTLSITYAGTFLTYPVIRITGPVTDLEIRNLTTDEKLDFDGVTIDDGHWYEINLGYGYKTVVDDTAANKIADLTSDSDLATWHLAADPEAASGINDVQVTGTGINANTEIAISYRCRYVGL